jgi:hypothetical protein
MIRSSDVYKVPLRRWCVRIHRPDSFQSDANMFQAGSVLHNFGEFGTTLLHNCDCKPGCLN